ncbi:hypothetical protein BU14_0365s0003 [Porphyra umbilicalis]|uniref:Peptidase A1 domain-containing protein n=1 Tax=Porphyra umbilicalis TaxID=2786 RepID=A0A1X6NX82_PORUM|nr:hypothetical protein BU14_0365s0003 [Porphyra umbilicalis]|eukprot:OSX73234.1 hypothetical protein BU14_0365s0003 [Porphyra umbilicalis]
MRTFPFCRHAVPLVLVLLLLPDVLSDWFVEAAPPPSSSLTAPVGRPPPFPHDGAPPPSTARMALAAVSRRLKPPDIVGTYNLVFAGVNRTCAPSFTVTTEGNAIGNTDTLSAQRFPGTALRRGRAVCGPSSFITVVTTIAARSDALMGAIGMPNATSRFRVSRDVEQVVAWAHVVGFGVGSLVCGDHPPLGSDTLALWGDDPWRLESTATGELVELVEAQRHLVLMAPDSPMCIFSAEARQGGDDGGGGDYRRAASRPLRAAAPWRSPPRGWSPTGAAAGATAGTTTTAVTAKPRHPTQTVGRRPPRRRHRHRRASTFSQWASPTPCPYRRPSR